MSERPKVLQPELDPELRRLLFLTILVYRTPELLKVGWKTFTSAEDVALHSMLRLAAYVGAAYKEAEIELGYPPTALEMSERFGLTLHEEGVPRAKKGSPAPSYVEPEEVIAQGASPGPIVEGLAVEKE